MITDADGSTAAGTLTDHLRRRCADKFPPAKAPYSNVDSTGTDHLGTASLNFAAVVGADEPGSVVFNIVNDATATDANNGGTLTHAGQAIHIFGNGTTLLTGYVDTDGNGTYIKG